MIGDGDIDLTEDLKFGRDTNTLTPTGFLLESIHRFPWKQPVRVTADEGLSYNGERLWGDTLSDEMGGVIRSTFNGDWFIGIPMKDRSPYFNTVFEEVRMELGLVKPGWTPCLRCGKLHLTSNPYSTCSKCNEEEKYRQCYNKLFGKYKYPDRYVSFSDYRTGLDGNVVHHTEFVSNYHEVYENS